MIPLAAGAVIAAPIVARAAPAVSRAATRITPAILQRAGQLLQGKITPEDVRLFGRFGELVERGQAKRNLGETGKTIQSFVNNVFGSEAGALSNLKIKQALDLLLQQKGVYAR